MYNRRSSKRRFLAATYPPHRPVGRRPIKSLRGGSLCRGLSVLEVVCSGCALRGARQYHHAQRVEVEQSNGCPCRRKGGLLTKTSKCLIPETVTSSRYLPDVYIREQLHLLTWPADRAGHTHTLPAMASLTPPLDLGRGPTTDGWAGGQTDRQTDSGCPRQF